MIQFYAVIEDDEKNQTFFEREREKRNIPYDEIRVVSWVTCKGERKMQMDRDR